MHPSCSPATITRFEQQRIASRPTACCYIIVRICDFRLLKPSYGPADSQMAYGHGQQGQDHVRRPASAEAHRDYQGRSSWEDYDHRSKDASAYHASDGGQYKHWQAAGTAPSNSMGHSSQREVPPALPQGYGSGHDTYGSKPSSQQYASGYVDAYNDDYYQAGPPASSRAAAGSRASRHGYYDHAAPAPTAARDATYYEEAPRRAAASGADRPTSHYPPQQQQHYQPHPAQHSHSQPQPASRPRPAPGYAPPPQPGPSRLPAGPPSGYGPSIAPELDPFGDQFDFAAYNHRFMQRQDVEPEPLGMEAVGAAVPLAEPPPVPNLAHPDDFDYIDYNYQFMLSVDPALAYDGYERRFPGEMPPAPLRPLPAWHSQAAHAAGPRKPPPQGVAPTLPAARYDPQMAGAAQKRGRQDERLAQAVKAAAAGPRVTHSQRHAPYTLTGGYGAGESGPIKRSRAALLR